MDENHRQILQKHRVLLRRELSAEEVATQLFADEVFDQEDLHEVGFPPTPERRVDALLEILPRKGPQAFSSFYRSLKNYREDLASKLLTPFSELHLEENGDPFGNAVLPCFPYNFTGRDVVQKEIISKVKDGFKLLPIVAPPGYGKSALACVIGHHLKQEGFLVLFFELKEVTTVYSTAVLILEKLDKIPCTKPIEQLRTFLRTQLPRPTILILDNSENVQAQENQKFLDFLVEIGKFSEVCIIVTTTQALGNLQLLPFRAHALPLEPLNKDDNVILWKKLNADWMDERSFNMEQLCKLCMGIPIFLEVAASLVTIGSTDIISLIEDLKSSPEVLLQEEQIACKMKVFLSRIPNDLKITLAKLAAFPAQFSYNEMKFLISISGLELRQRLTKLTSYSVLKVDKESATYKLHTVIQSVVSKARLDDFLYQEYNTAVAQFVQHYMTLLHKMYVQFVSHDNMTALDLCAEHKRNILHAFNLAIEFKLVDAVDTSTEVINLLAKCLNIHEFETVYCKMADLVKEDSKKYSDCMTSIGFKYLCYHGRQSNLKARRYLTTACQLQEACQSFDTEERAHALSKLGLCLAVSKDRNEYEKGVRLIAQGIVIRKTLLDREESNIRRMLVAGGYCDLAMAFSKHNSKVSIKIWEQMCLVTYQEILGIHPFTATLLQYIGDAYHRQHLYQQALEKKKQSLEMRKHLLTEYHQDTARSYSSLAKTLEALGQSEQAVEILEKTKHIQVKVLASLEDVRSTEFEIKRLTERLHNGVGR